MRKILFVPLDNRPCTLKFPLLLADIASFELLSPPEELLGNFMTPGDSDSILEWLEINDSDCDAALLSIDMIIFGGLVASRQLSDDNCALRIEKLYSWFKRTKIKNITAFSSVMRTLPTISDGSLMVQSNNIKKVFNRIYSDVADEKEIARRLQEEISDFPELEKGINLCLSARERNHSLNLKSLEWLESGLIKTLILGMDDIVSNGPNTFEKRVIEEIIRKKRLKGCFIYPGLDEIAMMAIARFALSETNKKPVFGIKYSNPESLSSITLYENTSVDKIIDDYLDFLGCNKGDWLDSEIHLFCHIAKKIQKEAVFQGLSLFQDVNGFISEIAKMEKAGKFVAVADVAFANGGDSRFIKTLLKKFPPVFLGGFAAWNTSGNTLGTVLAHSVLRYLYIVSGEYNERSEKSHQRFIFERLIDDWIYQSIIRTRLSLKAALQKLSIFNMDNVTHKKFSILAGESLSPLAVKLFQRYFAGEHRYCVCGRELHFKIGKDLNMETLLPWPRLFEIELTSDFDLRIL